MSDPLTWSIQLGRWAGVQIRVHFFLVLFVAFKLLDAALAEGHPVDQTAAWLLLLIATLALHELGHLVTAARLGTEPEDIRLWPLGNLVGPARGLASRSSEAGAVAAAGFIVSGTLAVASAVGLNLLADARMVFNPFGNALGGGAPLIGGKIVAPFTAAWWLGWFGYLNWVLFLANLIPALPLDMGRVLRAATESPWGGSTRDGLIGPWTARVCALFLGIVGLARILTGSYGGLTLVVLGLFVYLMTRLETRMLDEGGFFDEGLFGYDFSQGYTSLEAGAATVRPRHEGALARWRRRRSEQRRRRQEAKEAAQDQRMDEILAKIHREGRSALTAEEQRFLVRVSAKYKNRPRSRG